MLQLSAKLRLLLSVYFKETQLTLFYHIIDNSPFQPTNEEDFLEKEFFV